MTLKEKFKEILTAFWINDWEDKSEKVADEFAIGFADWINRVSYRSFDGNWYLTQIDEDIKKTTEELLEIYKDEKGL
jgi:hypothetical protein